MAGKKKLTAQEVVERYREGERDFSRRSLIGENFSDKSLIKEGSSQLNLSGARFNGADIRGTNFTNVNLKGAQFEGATAGLPESCALLMSLLLPIISVILTVFTLYLFTILWGTTSFPPAEKSTYSIIALITVPTFVWFILRQGIVPGFLILTGLIIAAIFVINFPNLAIFISIVTTGLFLLIGWSNLVNIPILSILLILGNYCLPFILDFCKYVWERFITKSVSFIVVFERLGVTFSIAVAELIITTISITTLYSIILNIPWTQKFLSYKKSRTGWVIILAKLCVLVPVLLQLLISKSCGGLTNIIPNNFADFEYACMLDFICILGALGGTFLGYKIGKRALANRDARYVPSLKIGVALSLLIKSTKFRGANLTGANFTGADLKNTDFRNYKTSQKIQKNAYLIKVGITGVTKMIGTHWYGVKNLEYARLQGTYLQYPQVRNLFNQKDNQENWIEYEVKNFDNLNLQGINLNFPDDNTPNLQKASFIDTNLNDADLGKANLSQAKLVRTLLDNADLSKVKLNEAIIEDWRITSQTKFKVADRQDKLVYVYLYLAKKEQLQEEQPKVRIQNQEDIEKLIDEAERRWNKIYDSFDGLSHLKSTVLRERWEDEFINAAKKCGIPLPTYHQLFESYCDQKLLSQSQKDSWSVNFQRAEIRVERLNRLLNQMDLFPILDHLGRLSIVAAVIFFIADMPERSETSQREQAEAHYRAWEMIRDSKTDQASSGRRIALERLKKDKKSLAGLQAPEAMLSEIDLNGADLTKANFQKANLSKAKLNGANLSKADLSGANLIGADLRNSIFKTANFNGAIYDPNEVNLLFHVEGNNTPVEETGNNTQQTNDCQVKPEKQKRQKAYAKLGMIPVGPCADLKKANLIDADLNYDLKKADLRGADIRGADFRDAKNLGSTKLEKALYNKGTSFPEYFDVTKTGAYEIAPKINLRDADLRGADLEKEDLRGADFRGAKLGGANLQDAQLEKTLYDEKTIFPEGFDVDQTGAYEIAPEANLRDADLSGTDLKNEDLRGADLRGANLGGAELQDTKLEKALYDEKTRFPKKGFNVAQTSAYKIAPKTNLRNADLRGADLKNEDLTGANLRGAILTGAELQDTQLYKALYNEETIFPEDFDVAATGAYKIAPEANLRSADLTGADLRGAELRNANLNGADLRVTDLRNANLNGADLSGADLSGANLIGAKNLTPEQVKSAKNWDKAKYDENFQKKLKPSPQEQS